MASHPLYAVRDYVGEVGQDTFSVPFPYILKAHVLAWVDGIPVNFTWLSDNTIKLVGKLLEPSTVRVKRRTPLNDRLVDFQSANLLTEKDLDVSALQLFYVQQETQDDLELGLIGNPNAVPVKGDKGDYDEMRYQWSLAKPLTPLPYDPQPEGWDTVIPEEIPQTVLWMTKATKDGALGIIKKPWTPAIRISGVDGYGAYPVKPKDPYGFSVSASDTAVIGRWDSPAFEGYLHTRIYRTLHDGSETLPEFSMDFYRSSEVGNLVDTDVMPAQWYVYWIRHENTKGELSAVSTAQAIQVRTPLDLREGWVGQEQLRADLAESIELITLPEVGLIDRVAGLELEAGSYVTSEQLASKDFASRSDLTGFVQGSELDTKLSSYVTNETLVNADYARKTELTAYVLESSLGDLLSSYVTSESLTAADFAKRSELVGFVKQDSLNNQLSSYVTTTALVNADYASKTDLTAYVTVNALGNTLSSYVTTTALSNANYASKSDLTAYVTNTALSGQLANYVSSTALANADYAKRTDLVAYTSSNNSRVSAVEQRLIANENEAYYSVKVDSQGRVAGFGLTSNTQGTAILFSAEQIGFQNDAGSPILPFSVRNGIVYMNNARVSMIEANSIINIDDVEGNPKRAHLGNTYVEGTFSLGRKGQITWYDLDPAFRDLLVRRDPNATYSGGTRTFTGTGVFTTIYAAQSGNTNNPPIRAGGRVTEVTVRIEGGTRYAGNPNEQDPENLQAPFATVNVWRRKLPSGDAENIYSKAISGKKLQAGLDAEGGYYTEIFHTEKFPINISEVGIYYEYWMTLGSVGGSWGSRQALTLAVYEELKSDDGITVTTRWGSIEDKPTTLAGYGIINADIPRMFLDRQNNPNSGMNWYSSHFTSWVTYMAAATQSGVGPSGVLTAPSGSLVTQWGLRSYIEDITGYGWTFESGGAYSTTPRIVAEIRSSDGSARFGGSVTAVGGFSGSGAGLSNVAASTFNTHQSNYKGITDNAVAGLLMWKNYGNGHVIFDASSGISPSGTSVNNTNPTQRWSGTYPTLMGWNGSATYGVRVDSARNADVLGDLSPNNHLRYIGWSPRDANTQPNMDANFTYAVNAPYAGPIIKAGPDGYEIQLNTTYGISGDLAFRTHNGDVGRWNVWRTLASYDPSTNYLIVPSWIRGGEGAGIYWHNGTHLRSVGNGKLRLHGGESETWIMFAAGGDVPRGHVYADIYNQIGFLNQNGSWSLRVDSGSNVYAGDFVATSDRRVKSELEVIEDALSKLKGLTGYTYLKKGHERRQAGYIAQDLEAVLPEGVYEYEGLKQVSNSAVIAILIEAVKELSEKLKEVNK